MTFIINIDKTYLRSAKKASFPEIFKKFANTLMETVADETVSMFDSAIRSAAAGIRQ